MPISTYVGSVFAQYTTQTNYTKLADADKNLFSVKRNGGDGAQRTLVFRR